MNISHSKSTISTILAIGFMAVAVVAATVAPASVNAQAATTATASAIMTPQRTDSLHRQVTTLSTVTVIADSPRGHDKGVRAGNLELEAYLREQATQIDSLARHLAALKTAAAEREKEIATLLAESAATRKARLELEERLRKYTGLELEEDLPPAKH